MDFLRKLFKKKDATPGPILQGDVFKLKALLLVLNGSRFNKANKGIIAAMPACEKQAQLANLAERVDKLYYASMSQGRMTVPEAPSLLAEARALTAQHRDSGVRGAFKLTFFRKPASQQALERVFDKNNNLRAY